MKLPLDPGRRFVVVKAPVGWELTVDGKIVHYCREPADALRYLADTMMHEAMADDFPAIFSALAAINAAVVGAHAVFATVASDAAVVRALVAARGLEGRDELRAASLAIAETSALEFKTHTNRDAVVARARTILEGWHGRDEDGDAGRRRQEGS